MGFRHSRTTHSIAGTHTASPNPNRACLSVTDSGTRYFPAPCRRAYSSGVIQRTRTWPRAASTSACLLEPPLAVRRQPATPVRPDFPDRPTLSGATVGGRPCRREFFYHPTQAFAVQVGQGSFKSAHSIRVPPTLVALDEAFDDGRKDCVASGGGGIWSVASREIGIECNESGQCWRAERRVWLLNRVSLDAAEQPIMKRRLRLCGTCDFASAIRKSACISQIIESFNRSP